MTARSIWAALAAALTICLSYGVLTAQGKSSWDSVYSAAQATRGDTLFADQCAKCHGADMTGGDAPSLAGSEFGSNWDDLSLGDLAQRIRASMPQDKPQSLTADQTADLIAAILKANKMPAGSADMPSQADAMKQIKYRANKP